MADLSSACIAITFKAHHAEALRWLRHRMALIRIYTPVCSARCHYVLYSHVYRFGATSKLDLCRWPSLADGYLSPLRERESIPSSPCKRSVLKRFNVNTRSNLSRALCRPREKGAHALVPYRSGRHEEKENERQVSAGTPREIVREEGKKESNVESARTICRSFSYSRRHSINENCAFH